MGYGQYSANKAERNNPNLRAESNETKRVRHVVKGDEVAHLWYHQAQDSARVAQGNYYFTRDTIYSYGSHFPIARLVKRDGAKECVFFTTRTYSVTTSGHISAVRHAIPADATVFHVDHVEKTPAECVKRLELIAAGKSRKLAEGIASKPKMRAPTQAKLYESIAADVKQAHAIAKWFGLKAPAKMPESIDDASALGAKLARAADLKAKKAQREHDAAVKARREKLAAELPGIMAWWRKHGTFIGSGFNGWNSYELPVMLRIDGDEIVSSMGARFPVSHAPRAIALIESVRARGEEWHTNGHTCHLGHYQIDRIGADGAVYAGCHVVPYSEVQYIAAQLPEVKQ